MKLRLGIIYLLLAWGANAQVMPVSDADSSVYESETSVELLGFNTEKQEFSPVYYDNKVLFTSERRGASIHREDQLGRPYYDVYVASIGADKNFVKIHSFKGVGNKKYHEGPVAINLAGNRMFYSQTTYNDVKNAENVNFQLKFAALIDGKWHVQANPSFNSSSYSCGQPCISPDGKWLYFVSDMPGGFGGADVYKAAINENGSIGEAINLGNKVNTAANEMFPFVHQDGILIYASNKTGTLGGLDIYVAELKQDGKVGETIHPNAPLNSTNDDFSLILDPSQNSGYLSSDRGEKGNDDIYSVELIAPFRFKPLIKGLVRDADGQLLAGVAVTLFDLSTGEETTVQTDENGAYELEVEKGKAYNITGELPDYFSAKDSFMIQDNEDDIEANLELVKDPKLALKAKISDPNTGQGVDSVLVKVTDNQTGNEESFLTSLSGEYSKTLDQKRLGDSLNYTFELSKEGYLTKSVDYKVIFDHEGDYYIPEDDFKMEAVELGGDLFEIIAMNPIYFDLGKSAIRPDAALELDKIVKVLNDNPNMVIELGAHTDSRGSKQSNRILSDKRAKASAQYIAERITNPERISGKGYGESKPVNECTDGVECSEEKHQLNRRTEFVIISM